MGAAAQFAAADLAAGAPERIQDLRDRLYRRLAGALPDRLVLNGPAERRLPNTLNISIIGARGHDLLAAIPRIAASTGSACHSGSHQPSPVLQAMGLDPDRSLAAVRLSLGRWTTRDDVDQAADLIIAQATTQPPQASHNGETPEPASLPVAGNR
jgi:cysteine desulfurase